MIFDKIRKAFLYQRNKPGVGVQTILNIVRND